MKTQPELTESDLANLLIQSDTEMVDRKKPLRETIDNAIAGEGILPQVIGGAASLPIALASMKPKAPIIYNV